MGKKIELECISCHHRFHYEKPILECPVCGETILQAKYDLESLRRTGWGTKIRQRPPGLWRYYELLPLYNRANIVTMGEGGTPLLPAANLGVMLGMKYLYIKDERQGPTGSFKDRQASVAISVLKEMGAQEAVVASTGNVAIAYAAYAARAGIKLWAFVTSLVPGDKMREAAIYGAEVIKVTGTYDQTKVVAAQFARKKGLFVERGIKSIAAVESMKTLAFEIAEQLGWRAPDWYIQSVSGGMGPIGVAKGFKELVELGLIEKVPAIGVVQSAGCAPMVRAFKAGQGVATPVENPKTLIITLATGNPGRAYELIWDHVREYGGYMEEVSDQEAFEAMHILAKMDGMSVEPAAAVAFAGLFKMVRAGIIKPDDVVVVNASGHTFPVEKQILGDRWARDVDVSQVAEKVALPEEGLLSALEQIRESVHKVVIIEDNADAARLLGRILKARGDYEVHIAKGGREGIEMAHKVRPDLIITDLMMPDVDGFQVIDMLKADEKLEDVPIIVITAKELTVQERERLNRQITTLLQKGSFLDEELLQGIVDALSKS